MSELDPRDLISAFIDGELVGEDLRAFEEEMASDPELAEEIVSLQALVSELGDLPDMEVPAAFSAAVLARVEDLPIPGSEVAVAAASEGVTGRVAAEEGVGLITETGAAADIPKLALSALTGAGGLSGLLDGLLGSLWLKVPVGAAVAALLALGMSHLIAPGTLGPPAAEFASNDAVRGDVPLVAGAQEDDGVVALDTASEFSSHRETSPADNADFAGSEADPLMARPAARVRSGSAAAPRSPSRTPERKRKTPDSAVGPEGVYEAEWEAEDEQTVAVAEEEAPSPTGSDFKDAGVAPAVYGQLADVTMDGEPLQDYLEPDADMELLAKRSASESRVAPATTETEAAPMANSAGTARRRAPVGSAAMAPSSAPEPAPEPTPEPAHERSPQTGNTLKVGSRAAANRLVQDLTAAAGIDVQVTRHPAFFVLALEVSVGDWDATLGTLRGAGELDLSAGAILKGERQRLALDVRW